MTQSCAYGSGCLLTSIGMFVIWWLAASILVWLTWNKVIGAVTKVKPVKPWQPLLLIATICVLAIPCWIAGKKCNAHKSGCMHSKHCELDGKSAGSAEGKGDCPYSHPQGDSPEVKKAE